MTIMRYLTTYVITAVFFVCPTIASAHLISIAATVPFPTSVLALSTTTATFSVTNITSNTPLTVIDRSQFPIGGGFSISSTTCGNIMNAGESCTIDVTFVAPAKPQTIYAELKEWASPSADQIKFPFIINVSIA